MSEVFGAVFSIKNEISPILKKISGELKGFSSSLKSSQNNLKDFDKTKLKDKQIKLKDKEAKKGVKELANHLRSLKNRKIELKANDEQASKKVNKLKKAVDKIKENKLINFTAKGVSGITKAVGKLAVEGGVVGLSLFSAGAGIAIKQAIDFEAQMANVGTLLDGDVKSKLGSMGDGLKKVSMDTGIATDNLSSGLYEVISAFGETSDNVKVLEIAAKAAKAGNAQTADSVKMLSAVTKGYGDTSADAVAKASDLAFATVKLGQTSFSELASSMGSVVPIASSMKVSQEELFGAMATLTGVTGSTAEVSTQLKATMQGFMNPSKEMTKALKEMGYSSGVVALESEGLGSILTKLKDSVNGDTVAFANMFSSVEAKNAVLALAGTQADNFTNKTNAMKEASGASEEAFKKQTSSIKEMANNIKNKGIVILTKLGEKALPVITDALDIVSKSMPKVEEALGSLLEKASPIVNNLGIMFSSLSSNIDFNSLGKMFNTTFTKISEVVSASMPFVLAVFDGIKGAVETLAPVVGTVVLGVADKFSAFFAVLGEHSEIISTTLGAVGTVVSEVLSATWTIAGPIFDLIIASVDCLLSAFENAFPAIKAVVETTWNIIKPIIEALGKGIELVAKGVKAAANFIKGGGSSNAKVSANATGTNYFSGGYTTVGEHGTELIELPAGAKIHSNSETKNILGTKGVNINISNLTVREEADIEKVAAKIVEELEKVDR